MTSRFRLLLAFWILPAALFSQVRQDTAALTRPLAAVNPKTTYPAPPAQTAHPARLVHRYQEDSTFSILFNISTVFYTARDERIDNFLTKYGYIPQQKVPVGINLELAAIPFNSKMTYSLSASTIISRQDVISSIFKLAAYRRFFEREHFWISAGAGLGTHGSRIILNGRLPPSFDSLAHLYNKELALRRTGFVMEPAVRFFWYPLQTSRFQLGIFGNVAYDFSFNRGWKVGYYNQGGQFSTFKGISKNTNVQSHHEFGWAFSDGLSFCFKFD
ncbi:MAG: hypothetical protein P4L51_10095 [Puia sp.]|nr:hypothetical protein [Puia sp.]